MVGKGKRKVEAKIADAGYGAGDCSASTAATGLGLDAWED
jgi:hypothetical protein